MSVVVVTWNGLHLLRPCVEALRRQSVDHELIVVDNGSQDGTAAWVTQAAPSARLIVLSRNHGFAGGNNAGMRVARGDLVVLLNNDTIPAPTFLAEITQPLTEAPDVGAVAGVLTFAHRPDLVAAAGICVSRDGVHREVQALEPTAALSGAPVEVFGASGGAVCLRRAALAGTGLFEERFFNYLEDADLAWRLRLRGWRCLLAPRARAGHVYSATSGYASPAKRRLLALNRWRVILRCMPDALLRVCAASILRYDLLASLYGCIARQPEILTGRLQALRELPLLLRERRILAGRSQVDASALERWLLPPLSIGQVLHASRNLEHVLRDRP